MNIKYVLEWAYAETRMDVVELLLKQPDISAELKAEWQGRLAGKPEGEQGVLPFAPKVVQAEDGPGYMKNHRSPRHRGSNHV